jgi:excisionase family DNA binding protein
MDNVLTVKEVAKYLRVHPSTVYKLLKIQQLPAFRIGSDWRFNREQIDAWMAELQKHNGRTRRLSGR